MRKLNVLLTGVVFAWGCATAVITSAPSAQAATFSWRFTGLKAVRENKDLVTWANVTALPEFAGFQSNLVQRVASSLAKPLSQGGANETNIAKALKPIAEDLVAYPTVYELNEQEGGSNTWSLAIQIPNDRHTLWQSSWAAIEKNGKTEGAKLNREGNWTTLGNGSTKAVLDKAKQPTADVLEINGDALLLKKIVPNLKPSHAELKVTPRGKGLRSEGKAQFEQDLPFKLTPWEIPTNTIREPLVAFTAIQGVHDRLAKLDAFKNHPAPNQLFLWSDKISFFAMYGAAKVDNPQSFIKDVAMGLNLPELNKRIFGNFEFDTNHFGLYLTGLPIAVPFLRPAHSNDANFVYFGTMPTGKWSSNAMPAELAHEVVSRTNLVYYDWELGHARLAQIRPMSQIAAMATRKPVSNFSDPANKWLVAAESKLGNTVTEVSKTGRRELSLVRSSDSGFSAFELFMFVQWVAGPPPEIP
ncbi:MAG TPA: hypothetical protein VI282_09140, partial [Verrucomicrobiae bacterium]